MSTVRLADVKTHLNITITSTDGELQAMIDAAEAVIESQVGPLGSVERTQRVTGSPGPLVLQETPIVSITSLTPVGGTAVDLDTLDVDLLAGTITRVSAASYGSGRYDIVYRAGRAECPADLKFAVMELVRHLWATQRNATAFAGSALPDGASPAPGAAYLMPYRVQELLAPHMQFGFA